MSQQLVPKNPSSASIPHRSAHDGLALSFDWKARLVMTLLPIVVVSASLAFMKQEGWPILTVFLLALWLLYAVGVALKARASLRIDDDDRLVVRRFFTTHTVEGADVQRVTEIMNGRSPDVMLHTTHGRVPVATSRLVGGHSSLFTWLATQAPQAELDDRAQKLQDTLTDRGLL